MPSRQPKLRPAARACVANRRSPFAHAPGQRHSHGVPATPALHAVALAAWLSLATLMPSTPAHAQTAASAAAPVALTPEELSKDAFFTRLGEISQEMVDAHGRDFAMGALVLAARWIAEGRIGQPKAH